MSGGDQNWQVGDLAMCIWHGELPFMWHGPAIGSVTKVVDVKLCDTVLRQGCFEPAGIWLGLEGWDKMSYYYRSFQKLEPHAPDAEDAETIRLLNGQPVKPAEPVKPKTPELV